MSMRHKNVITMMDENAYCMRKSLKSEKNKMSGDGTLEKIKERAIEKNIKLI
jgi:hypothetical protein